MRKLLVAAALYLLLTSAAQSESNTLLCYSKNAKGEISEHLLTQYNEESDLLLPDKSEKFKIIDESDNVLTAELKRKSRTNESDTIRLKIMRGTGDFSINFSQKKDESEIGNCLASRGIDCDTPRKIEALTETGRCKIIRTNWNFIAALATADKFYYFDSETVRSKDGKYFVWFKTVQTTALTNSGSWSSDMRYHLNCSKKTIKLMATAYFDRNNRLLETPTQFPEERNVTQGSIGEIFLRVACKAGFPNDYIGGGYSRVPNNSPVNFTATVVNSTDAKSRK